MWISYHTLRELHLLPRSCVFSFEDFAWSHRLYHYLLFTTDCVVKLTTSPSNIPPAQTQSVVAYEDSRMFLQVQQNASEDSNREALPRRRMPGFALVSRCDFA